MSVYAGAVIQGFPRVGANRQLKVALEAYWSGKASREDLEAVSAQLRQEHWALQAQAGLAQVVCNDFSWYDTMLDTTVLFGVEPPRFKSISDPVDRYFAMARGWKDIRALGLRKWYNTNYHYLVPELHDTQCFSLQPKKILDEYRQAKASGFSPRINLVGPMSFLALADRDPGANPHLLNALLDVYCQLISTLSFLDNEVFLQLDESVLAGDCSPETLAILAPSYERLLQRSSNVSIGLSISHGHAGELLSLLAGLPFAELSLDLIHGSKNKEFLAKVSQWKTHTLALGLIDGRNVWASDYGAVLGQLEDILHLPSLAGLASWRLASSCSLLHVPYGTSSEKDLPLGLAENLAFAQEKLLELKALDELFSRNPNEFNPSLPHVSDLVNARRAVLERRKSTPGTIIPELRQACAQLESMPGREPWELRRQTFKAGLDLPELPSTSIGSFPQTAEMRRTRKKYKEGTITKDVYDRAIAEEIGRCIRFQEDCGLDVLVHGEFERNDMVEYFGERLEGYAFTANGWVQSYGSRCVKPPIIYGDVRRPGPMTVDTWTFTQGLTSKPVKGMLTGPVTMLNWAFVRTDLERQTIARQIALALRHEVDDLVQAGAVIIQVDEAAFREGCPLRAEERKHYETWAAEAFRLAVGSAPSRVAVHTHMCYSDFTDMMAAIDALDADVISIEAARSGASVLGAIKAAGYRREIGPGLYDIHSPRIPSAAEMASHLEDCLKYLDRDKLWVNPDCGLKTRQWLEIEPALRTMVEVCKSLRNHSFSQ